MPRAGAAASASARNKNDRFVTLMDTYHLELAYEYYDIRACHAMEIGEYINISSLLTQRSITNGTATPLLSSITSGPATLLGGVCE